MFVPEEDAGVAVMFMSPETISHAFEARSNQSCAVEISGLRVAPMVVRE